MKYPPREYPQPLKALTLWQPWATFLARRIKRIETRGWSTDYRGLLAIHAAVRPVSLDDLRLPNIETIIRRHGLVPEGTPLEWFPNYFPLGRVLAVADLVNCTPTDVLTFPGELQLTEEYFLGNYAPGRFGFEMEVLENFDPGIPAQGGQRFWHFTFPQPVTHKEPDMARPKKDKTAPAGDTAAPGKMDETQAAAEQGAVDRAFSGPAMERPGVPTEPGFDEAPAPDSPPPVMPDIPVYAEAIRKDEFLPAFQKIVFVKFSREDLAVRAEKMAACDEEMKKMHAELAEYVKERKSEIAAVEAQRATYSSQVTAKGEEREVSCRKRINEETQEAVIFNSETLEIVETKKLTSKEMQVEMQMIDTHRAAAGTSGKPPKGSKVVKGNFPADRVVGAGEPPNPEADKKNEAAVQALAGKE